MRTGRPRKTLEQHRLDGTYRRDRHGDRQEAAAYEAAFGDTPSDDLDDEALGHWQWVVSSIAPGVLTRADQAAVESLAKLWATYSKLLRAFDAEADPSSKSALAAHRAALQTLAAWRRLAEGYGLTGPITRQRITVDTPEDDEPDPLALLQQRSLLRAMPPSDPGPA